MLARLHDWDRAIPLLYEAATAPGPSYRHLFTAELLAALAGAGAWSEAEDLIADLAPRAAGIGSVRTTETLARTAARLRGHARRRPANLRDAAAFLLRVRPPAPQGEDALPARTPSPARHHPHLKPTDRDNMLHIRVSTPAAAALVAVVLLFATGGPVSEVAYGTSAAPAARVGRRPAHGSPYLATHLYFGTGRHNGQPPITDDEFMKFVADVITPRFPSGLTIQQGRGQWRDKTGSINREISYELTVLYPAPRGPHARPRHRVHPQPVLLDVRPGVRGPGRRQGPGRLLTPRW